jgi:hypothetical protein
MRLRNPRGADEGDGWPVAHRPRRVEETLLAQGLGFRPFGFILRFQVCQDLGFALPMETLIGLELGFRV